MGQIGAPSGRRVYKDRIGCLAYAGLLFGAGGVAIDVFAVPSVLAAGRLEQVTRGGSHVGWIPAGVAVPVLVAFSLPFLAFGVLGVLGFFPGRIEMDEEGIRSVTAFGRERFRARWEEIRDVREDGIGPAPTIKIDGGSGTLEVPSDHPCAGEILRDVQAHSGKSPARPAPPATGTL